MKKYDFVIVGSGIVGLTIAHEIKNRRPDSTILIIDKEETVAEHASSRNSGVLHAGFYYTADSLKAKLTVKGNFILKKFCEEHHIDVNNCGKLVVARNEEELLQLSELEKRGLANGSNVKIITTQEAKEIEPNVKTYKKALFSPDTSSLNPKDVCLKLYHILGEKNVAFAFSTKYLGHQDSIVLTDQGDLEFKQLINCAGLYADKIAKTFELCEDYTILPFKGLYLQYTKNRTDIKTNIYPVPNLKNPFLGVHFTKTVTGDIKIGPTAIPAFWRENYQGMDNFDIQEFLGIGYLESKLFLTNAFQFRSLAIEEIKKFNRSYFIDLASKMVENIDPKGFTTFTKPGIRAQLLNVKTSELVADFVVESNHQSIHVLNAVSPAFTCSFSFAEYVVKNYIFV